jgi:heavy metal sensor kinase
VRYEIVAYRAERVFDEDLRADANLFASRLVLRGDDFSIVTEGLSNADALTLDELWGHFVITDMSGCILREDLHSPYMQRLSYLHDLDSVLLQRSGFGRALASDGTEYRFVSMTMPADVPEKQYVLHIGRSRDPLREVLQESLYLYLFDVPIILILSAGVGWILAGRALRPFEEVAQTAAQITSEKLNTRIVTQHREEEVQRLVQSFNAMVGRLHDSFQQMRQFNADAAHELRTPLAILQGENEVLLRSPALSEDVRSVVASNLEELERLTHIVNDMLTLAEAEAGNQILARKAIRLRPLVEDLVEQMTMLGADRNIEIRIGKLADVIVEGDELWVRRALLNILDNAIKYSKDGDRIQVSSEVKDCSVHIEVRDHGIGIAPEDLPHIFDRLYRADPARSRSSGRGTGLGLALVKWVVEAHQGKVLVTSQLDQGSKFVMVFPLAGLEADAGTHSEPAKSAADRAH